MSYGALDYFYSGLNLPESKLAPAVENPLHSYLYALQKTAHWYTIPKFLSSWVDTPTESRNTFDELEASITKNRPVVLCLYRELFHAHHVLAIGCDKSAQTIDLYDSNFPGVKAQVAHVNGVWKHSKGSKVEWYGWFIDPGYYDSDPPHRPPFSWRYCRTCHGLFTTSLGLWGACPGGGRHIYNEAFEYFLPCFEGEGEQGWLLCSKCQGLYKPAESDTTSVCPAKGTHVPKKFGTDDLTFGVMKTGLGETNWRRCVNCSALFWQGQYPYGACPNGGAHVPDRHSARPYVVDYRTVGHT
jgi:hypothetical protein